MGLFSSMFPTPAAAAASPVAAPTPAPTPAPAPEAVVSPLDSFTKLWETSPVDPNAPPEPGKFFSSADPVKMLASARKVDFAKSISPELMAKMAAGGQDSIGAFAAALNEVGQRAYAQATLAATQIADASIKNYSDGSATRLPSLIKQHSVAETIRNSNPLLQHPAAAPILEALQSQLTVKYPQATVKEIEAFATDYLKAFSSAANPVAEVKTPASEDWSIFG